MVCCVASAGARFDSGAGAFFVQCVVNEYDSNYAVSKKIVVISGVSLGSGVLD